MDLTVPEHLGPTFDALVSEIVEYRLHRYLDGRAASRFGEHRQFRKDGLEIDATFTVEDREGRPTSLLVESAGGKKGSPKARNVDYVEGVDLLLQRLKAIRAQVVDVYIDTTRTADLTLAERRLSPGGHSYPLDLATIDDLGQLRRDLLRSMVQVGRQPGSSGGGNARKRTRLVISVDDYWTSADLADLLASGEIPGDDRGTNPESTLPGGLSG